MEVPLSIVIFVVENEQRLNFKSMKSRFCDNEEFHGNAFIL